MHPVTDTPKTEAKHAFHTGKLEFANEEQRLKPAVHEIKLHPEIAAVFGIKPLSNYDFIAQTKTMAFSQGHLATDSGEPIGTLNDVTVTVTRMADPNTKIPFLFISLDYFATSEGFRTGDGKLIILSSSSYTHESYKAPQYLYFKNGSGGVMYTAYLGNYSFELECGWNKMHQLFTFAEHNFIDWFDLWEGFQHEVKGTFYRC